VVIGSTNSSSTSRSLTTQNCAFLVLQERFGDRLLTVLTILFALLLFVIAPLHAAGIVLRWGWRWHSWSSSRS